MSIYEKLLKIQAELKVPRGQYNSFGKYHYRSCEDIVEAVKPLAHKYNTVLKLQDELVNIGDRYYIKACAMLLSTDSDESIINFAYAREELEKKGMDCSQITGTASSYARKYALNGLLAIDDTKDADTDEHAAQTNPGTYPVKREGKAPLVYVCNVCGKDVDAQFAQKSKDANNGIIYCSRSCKEKDNAEFGL